MRKCDYCGHDGDDSQVFCSACGTPYEEQPLTIDQRGSVRIGSGAVLQSIGVGLEWFAYNRVHIFVGFILSLIGLGIFTWGCMWYARAKGYPRFLGLLGLFTILGLIALFLLPNRCKESDNRVA
jgi:hypothetical protein